LVTLYIVDRIPWKGDQSVARQDTQDSTTQNKCKQTSMSPVGFEPTTPVFKRAKTIHALDREATVIGNTVRVAVRNVYMAYTFKVERFLLSVTEYILHSTKITNVMMCLDYIMV
jgi:hypothetical protein